MYSNGNMLCICEKGEEEKSFIDNRIDENLRNWFHYFARMPLSLSPTSPFDESEKDVFIQLIPLCVSLSIESEIDGDISVSELDSDVRLCM